MKDLHSVEHAFNQLLLPIPQPPTGVRIVEQSPYALAIRTVKQELDGIGLLPSSQGDYLSHEIVRWKETGHPSSLLKNIVTQCLQLEPALGDIFPGRYFSTHQALQEKTYLSFEDASALLSHADTIARLLVEESMSCAQVASVLSARRSGFEYNWNHVQTVASALGNVPQVDAAIAQRLLKEDAEVGVERFADATLEDSIALLAEVGEQLGYPGELKEELHRFHPDRDKFQPAYSIILYGNLVITEFYDHPTATAAYEFGPRGEFFIQIQRGLFPSYRAKASAYLNNSKGAFAFDSNWAWGRKSGQRLQALALSDILTGISQMSYPARRAFATWMRAWLLRIEEVYAESSVRVLQPSLEGIYHFFKRLSSGNTKTFGILEQRAADCLSTALLNARTSDWEVRGRGDSVSASNTSKKKLGDIEFKSANELEIQAFEAHGGTLEPFYVDIHIDTFQEILPSRRIELDQHGKPEEWSIDVTFIAHKLKGMESAKKSSEVTGYPVNWNFTTFANLWETVQEQVSSEELEKIFNKEMTEHIESRWVSDSVKSTFNEMITPPQSVTTLSNVTD